MKCLCCIIPIEIDIFELSQLQEYIINQKLNISVDSATLVELVDFANVHNTYIYYDHQLKNTFNLRMSRKKRIYDRKISEYTAYFFKKYNILFQPDRGEAYDYFDIVSLWKLLKKKLF